MEKKTKVMPAIKLQIVVNIQYCSFGRNDKIDFFFQNIFISIKIHYCCNSTLQWQLFAMNINTELSSYSQYCDLMFVAVFYSTILLVTFLLFACWF